MPICTKCNQDKPAEAFSNRRRRDGTLTKRRDCASCHYEAQKVSNARNEQRRKEVRSRYWLERRLTGKNLEYLSKRYEFVDRAKDAPCVDCGGRFPPECMDFDHVRGEKLFGIGTVKGNCKPIEDVLAEMAKCELVCSNCHRIRTKRRRTEGRAKRYAELEE